MVLVHSNLLSNKCFPVLWRQRSNDITHCCWTGALLQELDGLGLSVGSLWQSNETNPELLGIVLGLLPLSGVKGGESKSISLMVSKEVKGNPVHGFMRFCYLVICVSGWFAHCSLMFICPMFSVFAEILLSLVSTCLFINLFILIPSAIWGAAIFLPFIRCSLF